MDIKNLTTETATRQNFDKIVSYWNMLPDPDVILRKINKDVSVYRELLTDPHLFSTVQQRKAGVLSLNWELQQADSSKSEFDLIDSALKALNMDNVIEQALNAPLFGFTVFEILWEKQGSYLMPAKVEEKPQEWFFFDQYNNLMLRKNNTSLPGTAKGEPVNPLKFILIQHKPTYNNPYGERALSRCFWPVTFKRGGLKFWITFTEKYGSPFLIGKLPRGASQEDIDNLLSALENMIQDAVAVIPDDSSVDLQEAQRSSSVEVFKELMNFQNSEISKAILTQTLTTEVQDTGTYAASKTMGDMLANLQRADQKLVEKLVNSLIKLIFQINFNSTKMPEFIMYADEDVDKLLAERDQILAATGIKFTKDYYIRNYNLLPEDFDLNEPRSTDRSTDFSLWNPRSTDRSTDFSLCNPRSTDSSTDFSLCNPRSTDSSTDFSLWNTPSTNFNPTEAPDVTPPDKLLQMQIESTLKPVLALIQNSESFETIMEELAKTYPSMNTTQLEETLTKLIFISEINGRTAAP